MREHARLTDRAHDVALGDPRLAQHIVEFVAHVESLALRCNTTYQYVLGGNGPPVPIKQLFLATREAEHVGSIDGRELAAALEVILHYLGDILRGRLFTLPQERHHSERRWIVHSLDNLNDELRPGQGRQ